MSERRSTGALDSEIERVARGGPSGCFAYLELAHMIAGVFFWVLLAALWAILFAEHKVTLAGVEASLLTVAVIAAATLGVTVAWVRHNVRIYNRKGPRLGVVSAPVLTGRDRLGREVDWDLPGGSQAAIDSDVLVVEIDGPIKRYRRAPNR